jgi:4-hydroxybenzoate polyprenyltransferase
MKTLLPYFKLMRFDRPIGFFLTGWPTLWALWLSAGGWPGWRLLVIFVLGIIIMRSAGCVINDIADRKFDPHVERTKTRPLVMGDIALWQAILLLVILLGGALLLVLLLNTYCLIIAIATACFTIIYPFCKRFTYLPQVILGVVFNAGILMAYAAQQQHLSLSAWVLYAATIIWTVAYDTMYALTDIEDDLKLGLKSTAILFKSKAPYIIALLQGFFLLGLIWVGYNAALTWAYYITVLAAMGLSVYQQVLVRRQQAFQGFLNNNWLGLIVFIGIVLSL